MAARCRLCRRCPSTSQHAKGRVGNADANVNAMPLLGNTAAIGLVPGVGYGRNVAPRRWCPSGARRPSTSRMPSTLPRVALHWTPATAARGADRASPSPDGRSSSMLFRHGRSGPGFAGLAGLLGAGLGRGRSVPLHSASMHLDRLAAERSRPAAPRPSPSRPVPPPSPAPGIRHTTVPGTAPCK